MSNIVLYRNGKPVESMINLWKQMDKEGNNRRKTNDARFRPQRMSKMRVRARGIHAEGYRIKKRASRFYSDYSSVRARPHKKSA